MNDIEKTAIDDKIYLAANILAEHYDLTREEVIETLEKFSDMKFDESRMSEGEINARHKFLFSEMYYLTYIKHFKQKITHATVDHYDFESVLKDIIVEFDELDENKNYEGFIALVNGKAICEVFIDDDDKIQRKFYDNDIESYINAHCNFD